MRRIFGYWRRAFRRAFIDTRTFLGHNWKKTVLGTLGTLLAFGVYGLWGGGASLLAKVEWWAAGIIAGLVLFVLVFLSQLFAAPARMEEEASKAAADRERAWDNRFAKLQAHSEETLAALKELRSRETDQEQRQRREVLKKLEGWLKEGEFFEGLCREPGRKPPRAEVKEWVEQVEALVRVEMGLAAVTRLRTNAEWHEVAGGFEAAGAHQDLVVILRNRMDNLRGLIGELNRA